MILEGFTLCVLLPHSVQLGNFSPAWNLANYLISSFPSLCMFICPFFKLLGHRYITARGHQDNGISRHWNTWMLLHLLSIWVHYYALHYLCTNWASSINSGVFFRRFSGIIGSSELPISWVFCDFGSWVLGKTLSFDQFFEIFANFWRFWIKFGQISPQIADFLSFRPKNRWVFG